MIQSLRPPWLPLQMLYPPFQLPLIGFIIYLNPRKITNLKLITLMIEVRKFDMVIVFKYFLFIIEILNIIIFMQKKHQRNL